MPDISDSSLPNDWKIEKISNLCDFIVDCIHDTPDLSKTFIGYYMIRTSDIGNGQVSLDNARYVSKEVFNFRIRRGKPQRGDIVISREAPLGNVGQILTDDNICLGQRLIHYRPNRTVVDERYLLFALLSPIVQQEFRANEGKGSIVDNLSMQAARDLPIPLPPLAEQRVIAKILGGLNDKIELIHRMNTTLESIIWTIFKSWFVDFDPVRSKEKSKQPTGMDTDTTLLFPSAFQGDTPVGWNNFPLGRFLTPISDRIKDEEAPEYSATVNGLSLRDEKFNKSLSKSKEKNKKIVRNNLVFGLSRQTLNFGVMKDDIGSVSPVYEIFSIDTNVYLPELLEMYIRLKMDEHIDILKPAARECQAIDRNYLLSKPILIPDMKIQKRYQEYCAPFRDKIAQNEKESRTLASLRDSLLPKLMRGEVRVKAL